MTAVKKTPALLQRASLHATVDVPGRRGQTLRAMADNKTELEEKIREALTEVVDPEIGLDVVALGLIREINIGEEQSEIRMLLTTPFCPYAGAMIQMTKEAAQTVLGMDHEVEVEILPDPWDPSMMTVEPPWL